MHVIPPSGIVAIFCLFSKNNAEGRIADVSSSTISTASSANIAFTILEPS